MTKKLFTGIGIGHLIVFIGILVAVPLLVLPFYPEEAHYGPAFAIPSLVSVVAGVIVCKFSKRDDDVSHRLVNIQNSSLTVLFAWVYGFGAGAVPFIIEGGLSPLNALFEAVSGWTSTGLTVVDVSVLPHIFLFHRSFMQFCGGLGFVLVILMFVRGKQSMILYNAEGHTDRVAANLKDSAQIIFLMYGGVMMVGTMLYRLFGMSFFDALLHSMSALSTGGFSTRANSIGAYDSLAIEVVTIILMLIGSTNFALLLLLARRKWKRVLRSSELRLMLAFFVFAIPSVALSLAGTGMRGGEAFRFSAFNLIAALTTAGFTTIDFNGLPYFVLGVFMVFLFIGGGIGSTAGGLKISRVVILLRVAMHTLKKKISPSKNVKILHYYKAQGKTAIDAEIIADTAGVFLAYLIIFIIGTLILTATGEYTLLQAGFEFSAALSSGGVSMGVVSAESSVITLVTIIVGMILGRLEIFIVFIGIYSGWMVLKRKAYKMLV